MAAEHLGLSLKEVGALGVVGAAALGAVAVALAAFNAGLKESQTRLAAALQAQNNYYDAAATLTSQQARDQIESIQRVNNAVAAQLEEARRAADQSFAAAQKQFSFGAFDTTPGGDLLARVGTALSGNQLGTQVDELTKKYQTNLDTITRLQQGYDAGTFAANDLREAEQQLTDARRQSALQAQGVVVNQLTSQGETYARANEMTAEQRRREVERLGESIGAHTDYQHRLEAIQATLAEGTPEYQDYKLAIDKQTEIIGKLTLDQGEYNLVFDSYADRLLRAAEYTQRITDQTDNYLEALDLEADAREKLIDIARQLAEIDREATEKSILLAQETDEKIRDAETDAADRRAKIIEDGLAAINKIQRDAGRKLLTAVGMRDALAFYQAKLHAQDQLDDQKEAQDKQLRGIEIALEKQRRTIERQYWKQQESIDRAFNERYRKLLQAQQQEQVNLINAQYALQQIALNGSGGLRVIHTNMWTDLALLASNGAVAIGNAFVQGLNSVIGSVGSGGSNLPGGLPGYQPWGGQGGSLSTASFNRMFDNRYAQTLSFARTGRQFG